jgi:hypothetical protein
MTGSPAATHLSARPDGRRYVRVIRVNAAIVLTGRVKSRFTGGKQIRFDGIDNVAERYRRRPAEGRRERGPVPLFLASDKSRTVNGAAVPGEGGFVTY